MRIALLVVLAACGQQTNAGPVVAEPDPAPPAPEATPVTTTEPAAAEELPVEQVVAIEEPAADGPTIAQVMAMDATATTSLGGPNDGGLRGGIPMPLTGPGFRFNTRRPREHSFGTVELIQALARAAAVVDAELPGSELFVNDLSLAEGGPINGHGSHQSGRDVDTLFYYLDREGNPIPSVAVPVDPSGEGYDFKDLAVEEDDVPMRLDVPRTWRFAQALVEDEAISINRLFVAEHVRTILLAHARRSRAPAGLIRTFEEITCQPSYPHDDHFHVRIFCAPDDIAEGCRDTGPIYEWQRRRLAELGLRPTPAGSRRRRPERMTTSRDAIAAAGPLHANVRAWLRGREAWMRPPRTGRAHCR